jgi:hypothetical protein
VRVKERVNEEDARAASLEPGSHAAGKEKFFPEGMFLLR